MVTFFFVINPLVVVNKQHGVNVKHQEYFADSPSIGMDPASRDEWVLDWIYARSLNILPYLGVSKILREAEVHCIFIIMLANGDMFNIQYLLFFIHALYCGKVC